MNNFKLPQILFIGNGLNLAYGGLSWSRLIETIAARDDFDWRKSEMPMPLQAILATNNQIRTSLKTHKELFRGQIETEDQMYVLQTLLSMGFDDILTTNYSYELEEAALQKNVLNDREITKLMRYTTKNAETHYLLHTYNQVMFGNIENHIWHIHGEIRKTDSMILGHYWYGNLLRRIQDELEKRKDSYARFQRENKPIERSSWVDSFILGDVYVLGFGYGLSEIDLWWLLNRKQREKAEHGKLFFYEIKNNREREKTALLELLGAEIISLGFSTDTKQPDYQMFYKAAIDDIRQKMSKS